MIRKRRNSVALSLVEVMIASLVLLVALPAIIDAAMSIGQWDRARDLRSHATHFGQLAIERTRFHMYDDDMRGYRLTDAAGAARTAYSTATPSWMAGLLGQAAPSGAVVDSPSAGAGVSRPFGELFAKPPTVPGGLTSATNPELLADVPSFRVLVSTARHVVSTDAALANKAREEPKIDVARLDVSVTWTDFRGAQREQHAATFITRPVAEPDPSTDTLGGN